MRLKVFAVLFCLSYYVQAQTPVPAPAQKLPVLILGATAHLGNGTVISNSAVGFENGKLTLVADATTIRLDRTKYAKIFDATGKHIYPGFIAPNSTVGLVEIELSRETVDIAETGAMNPNVRALIAYNADSEIPPTLRTNGVLMAQITPVGGVLSGASSVVQMDAWNWEDATIRADDGLHLHWPALRQFGFPEGENPEQKKNEQYDKEVQSLHRFFSEAKAYSQKAAPETRNLKMEAMRGLFDRKQNLYIHVDNARTMQEAVLFAEQYGVRPVLVEAADSWMVADFLKAHQVPVILAPTQRLPSRADEDVDQPFKTAATLQQSGVLFAFSSVGYWRQRNLPFQAGQAVGFGLPYEAAVSAITLNAAKILGIDGTAGSLETGKDATLFINEGDALDMRTCQVTAVFIQGREVNLDNKQKELYKKFGTH
jgi:imidazolonepropionase-like amidohydrolase